MTKIKAIIKEVRQSGASLYITVSFEDGEVNCKKEYRVTKAYGQEKILAAIRKDLHLFREHDRIAGKLKKFIGKEIPGL